MSFTRIYKVKSICLFLERSNPRNFLIQADGEVVSSGWKNSELTFWRYNKPPVDGIQDFDFVAEPPTGIVLQVISPIDGEAMITDFNIKNYWGRGQPLMGVRVHATSNSLEKLIEGGCKEVEPKELL